MCHVTQKTFEKQKKLMMKSILNYIRKAFNEMRIGFYPLLLCVSIKPGKNSRNSTLQSYPNSQLWRSIQKQKNTQIMSVLISKVEESVFKFKMHHHFDKELLDYFLQRIRNNFDFENFYKTSSIQNDQKQQDNDYDQSTEHNISIQKKNESEAKQLLTQIKLCNQNGSYLELETLHYHKLKQLLEKINNHKDEHCSQELLEFKQELNEFLENQTQSDKMTIKKRKVNQMEKLQIVSEEELLQNFKSYILQKEPGLQFFLPNYQNCPQETKNELQQLERNYFKLLYYNQKVHPQLITDSYILEQWQICIQQFQQQIGTQNIFGLNLKVAMLGTQQIKTE